MNLKIYKPEVFQGNLKKKNYFEGWYFKNVSKDLNHVWSFIPGVSLTDSDPHAFIQIINGLTGYTEYITYPLEEFSWNSSEMYIKVGKSSFTKFFIELNIENDHIKVNGILSYKNIVSYPKSILSPGIMGWYSFIPLMECKHGIVSVNHEIDGNLTVNEEMVDFSGGKGYIEKDWGTSFPEAWIWIQANNFNDRGSSFNFSVAKIPWLGKFFIGFIAFLYYDKKFFLYSTYNNSVITQISQSENSVDLIVKNKKNTLKIMTHKSIAGELMAPVSGDMSRRIKESIDSEVSISLYDNHNTLIYSDSSKRAGLEVIDKIFDYL
jgi:tocopherol cyclase